MFHFGKWQFSNFKEKNPHFLFKTRLLEFLLFPAEVNKMTSNVGGGGQETVEDVLLVYSRHCPGAVEWAKYLHKLYTELSKHKGKLR